MIHMVDQIRALGRLYLHEMCMYERFISILNRYVLNCAYSEGSMIEGYGTEKIIECCLGYLKDKIAIGFLVPRFFGEIGRGRHSWKENLHRQGFQRRATRTL
jgi:hypothetical protein